MKNPPPTADGLYYVKDSDGNVVSMVTSLQEGMDWIDRMGLEGGRVDVVRPATRAARVSLLWGGQNWIEATPRTDRRSMGENEWNDWARREPVESIKRTFNEEMLGFRVFEHTYLEDDGSEIRRIGFRSKSISVDLEDVNGDRSCLFFLDTDLDKYRLGVQLCSEFSPSYFMVTSLPYQAVQSALAFERFRLDYDAWYDYVTTEFFKPRT